MHQLVESPVAQFADTEIGDRVGLLAAPGEPTLCAVLATVTFGAAGAALEATLDGVFVVAAGAATATAVAAATEGTACGRVGQPGHPGAGGGPGTGGGQDPAGSV